MAKAILHKVEIPQPRYEVSIDLTLSAEEAVALYALLSKVGGSPDNSIRKHFDGIREALSKTGVYVDYPGDLFQDNRGVYATESNLQNSNYLAAIAKLTK